MISILRYVFDEIPSCDFEFFEKYSWYGIFQHRKNIWLDSEFYTVVENKISSTIISHSLMSLFLEGFQIHTESKFKPCN
jgi:hypothetical protein